MHGQRFFVQEMRYGSDGQNLYLRLDFVENPRTAGTRNCGSSPAYSGRPRNSRAVLSAVERSGRTGSRPAFDNVCEVRISLARAGISIGQVRFQISLWQGGLPMDALPPQGWIEFSTAEPMEWMI